MPLDFVVLDRGGSAKGSNFRPELPSMRSEVTRGFLNGNNRVGFKLEKGESTTKYTLLVRCPNSEAANSIFKTVFKLEEKDSLQHSGHGTAFETQILFAHARVLYRPKEGLIEISAHLPPLAPRQTVTKGELEATATRISMLCDGPSPRQR